MNEHVTLIHLIHYLGWNIQPLAACPLEHSFWLQAILNKFHVFCQEKFQKVQKSVKTKRTMI